MALRIDQTPLLASPTTAAVVPVMQGGVQYHAALSTLPFLNTSSSLAAANLTGTIDIARLPALPSSNTILLAGATIGSMTSGEQAEVVAGTTVIVSAGMSYKYKGTGSKTDPNNYWIIADSTPDWSTIANKPTLVYSVAGLINNVSASDLRATLQAPKVFSMADVGDRFTLALSQVRHGDIVMGVSITHVGNIACVSPYLAGGLNNRAVVLTAFDETTTYCYYFSEDGGGSSPGIFTEHYPVPIASGDTGEAVAAALVLAINEHTAAHNWTAGIGGDPLVVVLTSTIPGYRTYPADYGGTTFVFSAPTPGQPPPPPRWLLIDETRIDKPDSWVNVGFMGFQPFITTGTTGTGSIVQAAYPTITQPRITGGLRIDSTFTIVDNSTNAEFLRFVHVVAAVNEFQITNASATNTPRLMVTGNDTNIGIELVPKGTGAVIFPAHTGNAPVIRFLGHTVNMWLDGPGFTIGHGTNEIVRFQAVGGAVNEITITSATTNNAPKLGATGTDANIDVEILPKGTGRARINGGLSFADQAAANASMFNLGTRVQTKHYPAASLSAGGNGRWYRIVDFAWSGMEPVAGLLYLEFRNGTTVKARGWVMLGDLGDGSQPISVTVLNFIGSAAYSLATHEHGFRVHRRTGPVLDDSRWYLEVYVSYPEDNFSASWVGGPTNFLLDTPVYAIDNAKKAITEQPRLDPIVNHGYGPISGYGPELMVPWDTLLVGDADWRSVLWEHWALRRHGHFVMVQFRQHQGFRTNQHVHMFGTSGERPNLMVGGDVSSSHSRGGYTHDPNNVWGNAHFHDGRSQPGQTVVNPIAAFQKLDSFESGWFGFGSNDGGNNAWDWSVGGNLSLNYWAIDTSAIPTDISPSFIGRVKLYTTLEPALNAGDSVRFNVPVNLAGINAANFYATVATEPQEVSGVVPDPDSLNGKWLTEYDVRGLNPIHWVSALRQFTRLSPGGGPTVFAIAGLVNGTNQTSLTIQPSEAGGSGLVVKAVYGTGGHSLLDGEPLVFWLTAAAGGINAGFYSSCVLKIIDANTLLVGVGPVRGGLLLAQAGANAFSSNVVLGASGWALIKGSTDRGHSQTVSECWQAAYLHRGGWGTNQSWEGAVSRGFWGASCLVEGENSFAYGKKNVTRTGQVAVGSDLMRVGGDNTTVTGVRNGYIVHDNGMIEFFVNGQTQFRVYQGYAVWTGNDQHYYNLYTTWGFDNGGEVKSGANVVMVIRPNGLRLRISQDTLTYAAETNIDFAGDNTQTLTLTGDVTFTTSNRAPGRSITIRIIGDTVTRNLTFPAFRWVGSAAPTSLAANKIAILTLTAFGVATANIVAAYSAEV